ncbi:MAG: hypothetical protein FJ304_06910 [Planctomycetes bacterium]|nr:hypothetical protein [Planctomycetota bacterium]
MNAILSYNRWDDIGGSVTSPARHMQLESAEELIEALRLSGLFTPDTFDAVRRELAPMRDNAAAIVAHLLAHEHVTNYQLKKVLRGKAGELHYGSYVVTDRLGTGGMGKVYRARDAAGRTVALKVVRSALVANPTVRGRFAREVQAASKLSHPNIVGLLDTGEANGRFFLVVEFVDGIDLARLMHDYGVLAIEEACEYVRQAALGLHHAHERGLVHRDIKPGNLVVAGERHLPQATEPAVVKLLDLGLARAVDRDDMVAPDLTRDHAVVGTPDYMAPEQAKNSKLVDPRADLYSIGCTLYFLLTGRVPFPHGGAIEKILAHQTDPPPPLQALRKEVTQRLAEIVARLMAKRPDDRFQSAGELAEALAPFARYPAGAPPVAVVPVRDPARPATEDSGAERGGFPASAGGSSVSAVASPSAFNLPPEPGVHTVAPSDHTPRPAGLDLPDAPRPRRKFVRPPPPARRSGRPPVRAFWWMLVALALVMVANVVLFVWLISKR